MIEIPYWWNTQKESLKATIKKYRPDLVLEEVKSIPIPDFAPISSRSNIYLLKMDLLHLESDLVMLAEEYEEEIDPTGWLMSEKFDGIRCLWDGRNLLSKHGKSVLISNISS